MWKLISLVPALCVTLSLSGCSRSDRPALYPVSGTVTYAGKPLPNATVLLLPEKGIVAVGRSDAEGHFSLKTQGMDGVVAGPAKVAVSAVENVKNVSIEEFEKLTDAERAKLTKSLIPARYGVHETSGITTSIDPKSKNELTIELTE